MLCGASRFLIAGDRIQIVRINNLRGGFFMKKMVSIVLAGILSVVMLVTSFGANATADEFRDNNIEYLVETKDHPISDNELDTYGGGWMEITGQNITDERLSIIVTTDGIPKNVTGLNLDGNLIKDISPLIGFTSLEALWLDSNKIDNVTPLAELINLRELWLYVSR